ncbi:hypothetical protein C8R45DRAFT_931794 [Mycena sanguinolenta]|nr:hypothetical protein C8R45DRAFT_931794 [Mycena sanguinolenta]
MEDLRRLIVQVRLKVEQARQIRISRKKVRQKLSLVQKIMQTRRDDEQVHQEAQFGYPRLIGVRDGSAMPFLFFLPPLSYSARYVDSEAHSTIHPQFDTNPIIPGEQTIPSLFRASDSNKSPNACYRYHCRVSSNAGTSEQPPSAQLSDRLPVVQL